MKEMDLFQLLVLIALSLAVMACLAACSVTISYDLPSKTIQDYFFKPNQKGK